MTLHRTSATSPGFSLVEVAIAMGIVAFGLASILGAYSSIQSHAVNSGMRDDATFTINSIQNYLQTEKGFNPVFDEIKNGPIELIFFTYRGVDHDQPNIFAQNLYGHCANLDSDWEELEKSRDGQMFRAIIDLDETVNPTTRTQLAVSQANQYEHAYLALHLSLYDIYNFDDRTEPITTGRRSVLTTTIVITR